MKNFASIKFGLYLAAILLGGCLVKAQDIRARMDSIRQHRPVVGLVLSGGGAKGAAEVGVLRCLDSLAIPVDLVTGTSIGGLVGAFYCSGYNWKQMDSLFSSLDWTVMLSDKNPPRYIDYAKKQRDAALTLSIPFDKGFKFKTGGMYSGLNVGLLISRQIAPLHDSLSFARLPIPFVCVATDLTSGKAKIWNSGSLATAMRSTMSIPVIFAPVHKDGMMLVDGGLMNNFPIDIAKELGADIIIAVDLSVFVDKKDRSNNIAEVVTSSIDLYNRSIYWKNVEMADVIIHPDLKGYDMLSFTPDAIRKMTALGYKAAVQKADTLIGIKRRVEACSDGKEYTHSTVYKELTPTVDEKKLLSRRFDIASVKIAGLPQTDSAAMARRINNYLKPGSHSIKEIETVVRTLFGTGAFEAVNYYLKGSAPYTLVFDCRSGPSNRVGVGIRMDSEELVSVLLDLGFGAYNIQGSSLNLSGKAGINPYLSLQYKYRSPAGMAFGAEAYYKYIDFNRFRVADARSREIAHYLRGELFASSFNWNFAEFKGGARAEFFNIQGLNRDTYLSLFAQAATDTRDNLYFPTRGHNLRLSYSWHPYSLREGKQSFNSADLDLSLALPLPFGFTLMPSAFARANFGGTTPLPYQNMAGGQMAGRYYTQQLPFMGLCDVIKTADILAVGRIDLRYRIATQHYLTAIFNVATQSDDFKNLFGHNGGHYTGAALEYGFDSIAGPLKAGIGWNDITRRVNFFFTIGKNF